MTLEEAQAVARIVSTCDEGCDHCLKPLVARLNATFPEFKFAHVVGERWNEPDPSGFNEYGSNYPVIAVAHNAQPQG